MNSANLLVAEAPVSQPLPTEPSLPTQPVTTDGNAPFAKIMDGTIAETPTEPVPQKNQQEGDGDQKKNDSALALLANIQVSAPVVLPVALLSPCAQTQSTAKTDVAATSKTNTQSSNVVVLIRAADPNSSVVSINPVAPNVPPAPNEPDTSDAPTATDASTVLPSTEPAPIVMPAVDLPANVPLKVQQLVPEQTREDSHPTVAASTAEPQTLQLSEAVVPQGLSAIQIQTPTMEFSDGTVIAKQDYSMKREAKADKSSAPAEKTLPRGNFSPFAKADTGRPMKIKEAVHETSEEPGEPSQEIFVPREKSAEAYGEAAVQFKHFDVKFSPDEIPVDSVRAPQAEKVFNGLSEQVVAFKKVGVNSMDAVLRPDGGTEISLHLSLRSNGQVDVVARVERGDFEGLQAHWSELQSSLAQQGVRIGELHQSSLNHQTSSHEPPQYLGTAADERQQAQRQTSRSPETLDELPLVGSVTEPLKGRTLTPTAATRRGWEKWA